MKQSGPWESDSTATGLRALPDPRGDAVHVAVGRIEVFRRRFVYSIWRINTGIYEAASE
jgi:hypothetical protein